jgi:hypothetical protein
MVKEPSLNIVIRPWTVLPRIFLVVFLLFPFVACSTLPGSRTNKDAFASAVESFNTALRWGDYKLAAAFVAAAEQERFWRFSDLMEGRIKITNYEIRQLTWNEVEAQIPVFVKFQYFFMNDPYLQTRTIRQQWLFSEQAKGWQVAESDLMDLVRGE